MICFSGNTALRTVNIKKENFQSGLLQPLEVMLHLIHIRLLLKKTKARCQFTFTNGKNNHFPYADDSKYIRKVIYYLIQNIGSFNKD